MVNSSSDPCTMCLPTPVHSTPPAICAPSFDTCDPSACYISQVLGYLLFYVLVIPLHSTAAVICVCSSTTSQPSPPSPYQTSNISSVYSSVYTLHSYFKLSADLQHASHLTPQMFTHYLPTKLCFSCHEGPDSCSHVIPLSHSNCDVIFRSFGNSLLDPLPLISHQLLSVSRSSHSTFVMCQNLVLCFASPSSAIFIPHLSSPSLNNCCPFSTSCYRWLLLGNL